MASAFIDNEADDDDDDDDENEDTDDKKYMTKFEAKLNALNALNVGSNFCAEVSMKKKKINDNKPIIVGQAILQHAKLLLLKFMTFIGKKFLFSFT